MENKKANEIRDFDDETNRKKFLKIIKDSFPGWDYMETKLDDKTVITVETDAYLGLALSLLKLNKFGVIKADFDEIGSETDKIIIYDCDMDAFAKVLQNNWSNLCTLFPHPEGGNEYSVRKNVSIYNDANVNVNDIVFKRPSSEIQSPEKIAELMLHRPRYWKDESKLTARDLKLIEKYKQKHSPSPQLNPTSETQKPLGFSSSVRVWDEIRQHASSQQDVSDQVASTLAKPMP